MAGHHIVPRFHLARWACPDGLIEILERRGLDARRVKPADFGRIPGFNDLKTPEGASDPWLEHVYLGSLDSDSARMMRELERVPRPMSQIKVTLNRKWHPGHILSPKSSARMAMYLGNLAVRTAAWRSAIAAHTVSALKNRVESSARAELKRETDPARRRELEQMLGLRMTAIIDAQNVGQLSAHLGFRLGEILYSEYFWSVMDFGDPVLVLGSDPLLILNEDSARIGSFAQVASGGEPHLSLDRDPTTMVADVLESMRGHLMIALPLDPRRALVLSRPEKLLLPGTHRGQRLLAGGLNLVTRKASEDWVVFPPGHHDTLKEAIYKAHPWRRRFDVQRAAGEAGAAAAG